MRGLAGGIQGLTKTVYNNYILLMYELSKDLRNFYDDGTTTDGVGTGRHDQTLFSIIACLQGFDILINDYSGRVPLYLFPNDKQIALHISEPFSSLSEKTAIYLCRRREVPHYRKFIKRKS